MTDIKGYTKATLSLDPAEHNIHHTIAADAEMTGGKLHFKKGVRISGTVTGCEELVCEGMLIIESGAKVQAKSIHAANLASMGDVEGEHCVVTGTLIAWAGLFNVAKIDYAAFEKSADCVVRGSLDQIDGEVRQENFSFHPIARASLLASGGASDHGSEIAPALRAVI